MLGERIASKFEVIRAIVSGYGPCCGVHSVKQLMSHVFVPLRPIFRAGVVFLCGRVEGRSGRQDARHPSGCVGSTHLRRTPPVPLVGVSIGISRGCHTTGGGIFSRGTLHLDGGSNRSALTPPVTHGLSSSNVALMTSDCGTTRSPSINWPQSPPTAAR